MYDELISSLRNCRRINSVNDNCIAFHDGSCEAEPVCMYELMHQAADAIEELTLEYDSISKSLCESVELTRKLQKPKWIPVTERLPEAERKSYWVCTDTGYQCECRWTNNLFGIGKLDEWGWSIFDIPQYQKVVAWMPLPEPYEPPKEET